MDPFQFWWSRFQHAGIEQFNHWTLFAVITVGLLAYLPTKEQTETQPPRLLLTLGYLLFAGVQSYTLVQTVILRNHASAQFGLAHDANGQQSASLMYPEWEKSLDPLNKYLVLSVAVAATVTVVCAIWWDYISPSLPWWLAI